MVLDERPPNIETKRLALIALLPDEVEALMTRDLKRVAQLTGLRFPAEDPNQGVEYGWHLRAMRSDSGEIPWRIRLIVERSSNRAVGSINLKGPPSTTGDVEIGWGLILNSRGKGFATEAAAAVIRWVMQQEGVKSISATIPDDNLASQRLAHRLGLHRTNAVRRNVPLWIIQAGEALE